MELLKYVQMICGIAFLLAGIVIFCIQIFGVFRFHYVMNRMHAASMGDTLGISISLIGLMIVCGFSFMTLKLGLVILFLWIASPVSSHLIARLEYTTNEELEKHCELQIEEEKR